MTQQEINEYKAVARRILKGNGMLNPSDERLAQMAIGAIQLRDQFVNGKQK